MDDTITLEIHQVPCASPTCAFQHPQITGHTLAIHFTSQDKRLIGHIKSYTFSKAAMDLASPNSMWEQSQAFDDLHSAKLDKIENFLANEGFEALAEERIATAQLVLFIDQVWLETEFRKQGLGLVAVRKAIEALRPGRESTVVMLQAGDVGGGRSNAHEAGEKLTKYWGQLGFEPWSESDDSWLLLWLEEGEGL